MCLTEQESFRLENAEGFLKALLKLRQDHMRLSEKGGQDMGHMVSKGGLSSSERDVPSLQPHTFWLLNLLQGP